MDHALRRARLAERLAALELDALVVARLPNVRYLTGFTGSNGQVIVGRSASVFLTDGRYDEQSSHEVGVERRIYLDERSGHLARALGDLGARRAGFEREGLTYGEWERLGGAAPGIELVPTATRRSSPTAGTTSSRGTRSRTRIG